MRHDRYRGVSSVVVVWGLVCDRAPGQSERGDNKYWYSVFHEIPPVGRRARSAWRVPTSSASMIWYQVRGSASALSAAYAAPLSLPLNVPHQPCRAAACEEW